MMGARGVGMILGLALLISSPCRGQQLTTTSGSTVTLPAADFLAYEATVTSPGPTHTVTINRCGTNRGCALSIAAAANPQGLPLQVEWRILQVSTSGQASNPPRCVPTVSLGVWQQLPASQILTTDNSFGGARACHIVFEYRVTQLSYAQHQAPGRNGSSLPYEQAVTISLQRK